ncbi:DUF488 family protein [Brevundimonas olei]|uniref:DUF488 family protein n=1 Tax=Brevundimonas olei TaxID=657642 RepID=UPI003CD09988
MAEDFRRPFFTIGHSTCSIEEMAELLRDAGAEIVVDVRKMPRSRANRVDLSSARRRSSRHDRGGSDLIQRCARAPQR